MSVKTSKKELGRVRRKRRVRKKVFGTAERPRLSVYRSSKHIYAQVIDDQTGTTLASASTVEKEFAAEGTKSDNAKKIGEVLAERCKAKQIETVVFDRNGYPYHSGRVRSLAEGAREGGLKF